VAPAGVSTPPADFAGSGQPTPTPFENDPREGAHERRGRDRHDPGDADAAGDAPPDTVAAFARPDAHDRTGHDLNRRDRHAEQGGAEDDDRGRRLRGEAVNGLQVGDPVAHRLLRVVRAVAEGHEAGGEHPEALEQSPQQPAGGVAEDPEEGDQQAEGAGEPDQKRGDARDHDLVEHAAPIDRGKHRDPDIVPHGIPAGPRRRRPRVLLGAPAPTKRPPRPSGGLSPGRGSPWRRVRPLNTLALR
jgi:hypothetical protein